MNDLIQEAGLGLMKAADKFDPDRGVRFSTYAVWWIKAGIQDYVMRNWSMVRTGSTSSQKSLFFNMRRVQARIEREAMARGEELDGLPTARDDRPRGRRAPARRRDDGRAAVGQRFLAQRHPVDRGRRAANGSTRSRMTRGCAVTNWSSRITTWTQLRGWLARRCRPSTPRKRFIVRERKLRDPRARSKVSARNCPEQGAGAPA